MIYNIEAGKRVIHIDRAMFGLPLPLGSFVVIASTSTPGRGSKFASQLEGNGTAGFVERARGARNAWILMPESCRSHHRSINIQLMGGAMIPYFQKCRRRVRKRPPQA